MRTIAIVVAGLASAGSLMATACSDRGDRGPSGRATDGVTAKATAASERGDDDNDNHACRSADSSPFITGVWKFIPDPRDPDGMPKVDTEFRFINPTALQNVLLEYAFFELDGTFCGCDRDMFTPNHTTVYTVLGEKGTPSPCSTATPPAGCPAVPDPKLATQFACTDTSGALKAIVFKHKGQQIFFDDATQVGFQTHVFGNIVETPPTPDGGVPAFNFITGHVMTEAAMGGVAITNATLDEARALHANCVKVQGSL
jgi:hypothetical protein